MSLAPPVSSPPVARFDQRRFRDAAGRFATGVTVVTTRGPDGTPAGVTVNSFTTVSLDPPLVLFCLGGRSRALPVFLESRCFAVSILAADQRLLSDRFAQSPFGWEGVAATTWDSGAPILIGCLAAFDCTTETVHDGGDHAILLGRVRRLEVLRDAPPLLYYRSSYARLGPAG